MDRPKTDCLSMNVTLAASTDVSLVSECGHVMIRIDLFLCTLVGLSCITLFRNI